MIMTISIIIHINLEVLTTELAIRYTYIRKEHQFYLNGYHYIPIVVLLISQFHFLQVPNY